MMMLVGVALVAVIAVLAATKEIGAASPPAFVDTLATTPSFLFLLGDDIGWADFSYNGGDALTPNIDKLVRANGTILMQDFHSGGTVCSPTRATILTGRNHARDCVDFVYDCSDMTECVPNFSFAPNNTFTVPMAVKASNRDYYTGFFGKWHLGSLYNDSEAYGGIYSSPIKHGFDYFNATLEVAPTATANCNCNKNWTSSCLYGHDIVPQHCAGATGPAGSNCCFNYWTNDDSSPHGVSNISFPTPPDDTMYLTDSFDRFLDARGGKPFMAQISFHNCHIPYIGLASLRKDCREGKICKEGNFSFAQQDYYSCLIELDAAVGRVFASLEKYGYANDTMTWFAIDNGPEGNCEPDGICNATHYQSWPGSASPLRGRKRDIWEGGHRVPGFIRWPAVIKENKVSWDTVVTVDFMATVMDILGVDRPQSQRTWHFDGVSILPLLTNPNKPLALREYGWMFCSSASIGFRSGPWKLVGNTRSCAEPSCHAYQLFNLDTDLHESVDLKDSSPDVFLSMMRNMTAWFEGVQDSRENEQACGPYPLPVLGCSVQGAPPAHGSAFSSPTQWVI